jgi:hypothetical protein
MSNAHGTATDRPPGLRAVVVTYDDAADRRTLYPPSATETERLTRWLTADADDFTPLDEMR